MPCEISYIPKRLHCNGRDNIEHFYIEEKLYRRSKVEETINPFASITLVDISVNRSGPKNSVLSEPEDVLFNTTPGKYQVEKFGDMAVVALVVKELDNNKYIKSRSKITPGIAGAQDVTHTCRIELHHDKDEPCIYPHSTFKIFFDDVEQTFDNYNQGLNRHKQLRNWCRQEIGRMIERKEVRINTVDDLIA